MTRTNLAGLGALSLLALVLSPACGPERTFAPDQGSAGSTMGTAGAGAGTGAGTGTGANTSGGTSPSETGGSGPTTSAGGEGGDSEQPPLGTCAEDQKECDGVCVAIDDPAYGCSPNLCSSSTCPAVEGATFACESGVCVVGGCATGDKLCGAACVSETDPAFGCGGSTCDASACPNPGAGGSLKCEGGACVIDTCAPTFKKCGDKCVSLTDPTYGCSESSCDASSCPNPGSGTLTCQGTQCVIGTCGAGTKNCNSKCVPTDANNGCANPARCTACASNEACQGSPTTCQCVPLPQSTACAGKCGSVSNGCGGTYNCNSCSSPNTCGGGGTPNVCGCTALSKATACGNKNCGTASNGCGGNHNCGTCSSGTMCLSGSCKECGALSDCDDGYFACVDGTCSCAQQTSVNLLTNAGFDRNLTGWTATTAKWNAADSDNCPRSGSVAMTGGRIQQCAQNAIAGKDYTLGMRVIGASDTPIGCFGSFHTNTTCTNGVGPDFINLSGGGTGHGFWETTMAGATAPAGTKAILIECFTNGGSGVGSIDQIYLSVGKPGSSGAHF